MMFQQALIVGAWLSVAILAGGYARSRGRSAWTWFLLAFITGPIAAMLLVTWPPVPAKAGREDRVPSPYSGR